ncbi:MAG TPA: VOC family protein [Chitinophagaceae bacterium]|nr:VOC family protein [Chitinophagaceae bacterium]
MLTVYLTFNGNTEDAFSFYKSAFGGEFTNLQRFSDTPHGEQMSEADKKKIMHITLEASQGLKLMGNDYLDFMGKPFNPGNNFSLSLHPDSEELADKLFNSLSAGGTITMPLERVFWGAYFGMFVDKFGIQWMVNHQLK